MEKDEARNLEVRFQDKADRALMPMLADTVTKARDALTRDLGVTWPKPQRTVSRAVWPADHPRERDSAANGTQ